MTEAATEAPQPLALTIPDFCQRHGISRAYYYLLKKDGKAPREMKLGRRRMISLEEAAAWRERMADEGEDGAP